MNYKKLTLDKKNTGEMIYSAISDSGFTYEEISVALNLNTSRVIYEWVNGNKLPSTENLFNLAIMLKVKMEDLISLR